jgi:hypothetical protein
MKRRTQGSTGGVVDSNLTEWLGNSRFLLLTCARLGKALLLFAHIGIGKLL